MGYYTLCTSAGQLHQRTHNTTHVHIHAGHFEEPLGRVLLERVPVELASPLVPLDRVQHVALHVVVAGQQHILAGSHGHRDAHLVDLDARDGLCEMEMGRVVLEQFQLGPLNYIKTFNHSHSREITWATRRMLNIILNSFISVE